MFSRIKNKNKKTTYSQCGEDIIVKHIFNAMGVSSFSYLDIGAHHPFYLSNTALFYEMGMKGINIEPDPTLIEAFIKYRKRDINLNIGITEVLGNADFYVISSPTLNTFSKDEAEKYADEGDYTIREVIKVETDTIDAVLKKYCNGVYPEFLTIDAEGVDELLIRSIDFENNYPIVICIETISFSTSGRGEKNHSIIDYLESKGYYNYADTNINTIFVRRDRWLR
jgi:FkbM family methyltransferase